MKPGLNPNSSSLGVDVTFLLVGAALVSLVTPVVSGLLRWRRPADARSPANDRDPDDGGTPHDPDANHAPHAGAPRGEVGDG